MGRGSSAGKVVEADARRRSRFATWPERLARLGAVGQSSDPSGRLEIVWLHKPLGTADWELFNLRTDPGETLDLSTKHPKKKKELLALWAEYVKRNNVIIPDRQLFETLEDVMPVRVPVDEGWPPLNFKRPFVPPREFTE